MGMSQINFEDRPQFQKGKIGEAIIRKHLNDKGWTTYSPDGSGPHYFDMVAMKNKEKVIALDVKTKARLNFWNAQGINLSHYEQYMKFVNDTNVPFYLVFVDDKNGDIHVGELAKLKNPIYPCKGVIAWSLEQMNCIGKITDQEIETLSKYDARNHPYNPS